MTFWRDRNVLVTGGAGFLGTHVVERLRRAGAAQVAIPRSATCDLREAANCRRIVQGADVVIHLAARVGGIGFNRENPATLFYDNMVMGLHLMEEARRAGVEKFVAVGTVCAYPKFTPVPFHESDLWAGYPEETNAPYGLAKKMLLVQAQAYREQHGFNAIYLLPVNLYGPGDNFDRTSSHVIPALIRKLVEARNRNDPFVEVWGDGSASREFLYVEDAARAIVLAAERYDDPDPVNLGSGREITIRRLVAILKSLTAYRGGIVWNTTKPNGQPRRSLDVERAARGFGFRARTDFLGGLQATVAWYERVASEQYQPALAAALT